jgi:hypothetical protein
MPTLNHDNNYDYHHSTPEQRDTYRELREKFKDLAQLIDAKCPDGRERAVAHTQLETAMMWACAAIWRSPIRGNDGHHKTP